MKVSKVITVVILGPLLGAVIGFCLGTFSVPIGDPQASRAPGDGFLIILYVLGGFAIGVLASSVIAFRIWRGPKDQS
ncbi:MAG TPA: hypothetical protein VGV15_05670 [Terriglobales bacterium]|nr:hypothetical protein [Terriglobales bacterium]